MKQYHTKNMQQSFTVEKLPKTGFQLSLEATPEECIELASQLHIENVASFTAQLNIKQWRRGGVHIEGEFETKLSQICVISLESFESTFKHKIKQKFFGTTKIPEFGDKKEVEMIDNDMDPPEALVDGVLNIFDYLVETLLLQLDPYPKKPDSQLESLAMGDKFEINQPTVEDEVEPNGEHSPADAASPSQKVKKIATHKPFADLSKLLNEK